MSNRTKPFQMTCPFCGIVFQRRQSNQIYCSTHCRRQHEQQERRKAKGQVVEPSERVCPVCGDTFRPKNYRHTYCSMACQEKSKLKAYAGIRQPAPRRPKGTRDQGEFVRPCHDCGKPTTDYRCPKCLSQWRARYHVSPSALGQDRR